MTLVKPQRAIEPKRVQPDGQADHPRSFDLVQEQERSQSTALKPRENDELIHSDVVVVN
ncbi:MAG TPA: hypothetical protein VIR54_28450 [Vicinamibacterales bacterium]